MSHPTKGEARPIPAAAATTPATIAAPKATSSLVVADAEARETS